MSKKAWKLFDEAFSKMREAGDAMFDDLKLPDLPDEGTTEVREVEERPDGTRVTRVTRTSRTTVKR